MSMPQKKMGNDSFLLFQGGMTLPLQLFQLQGEQELISKIYIAYNVSWFKYSHS